MVPSHLDCTTALFCVMLDGEKWDSGGNDDGKVIRVFERFQFYSLIISFYSIYSLWTNCLLKPNGWPVARTGQLKLPGQNRGSS